MKSYLNWIKVSLMMLMCSAFVVGISGCSTTRPTIETYHTVSYVQPEVDETLFEPVVVEKDGVSLEQFKQLPLKDRFVYFGEKIINLQKALDVANQKLDKLKELYIKNKATVEGNMLHGDASK